MLSRNAILAIAFAVTGLISGGPPEVAVHGNIGQLVRQRDTAPKVELAEVLRTPHAYGLGSLSDLRGEITIVDGTAWLSYPPATPGGAARVVATRDSSERAGFLVATHVEPGRWREVKLSGPITSDNLESVLAKLTAETGIGGVDLPFRIEGRFARLTLAIVDGSRLPPGASSEAALKRANHVETETDVTATLVGFLAAKPDERFTHPGKRVHVHAVIEARRLTGHAQSFDAPAGLRLWLPTGLKL